MNGILKVMETKIFLKYFINIQMVELTYKQIGNRGTF